MTDQPVVPLRPKEVAAILGLHWQTVKSIPASDLPYTRVNSRGDRRYTRADVEAYLAARRVS
jgi:hypothetical protein